MTRSKFYIMVIVLCLLSAIQILFANNKSDIVGQIYWLFSTVFAYGIWCDWDWFPKSWWRKNEDSK